MQESLLELFPGERRGFWKTVAREASVLQEIRLRVQKPVVVIKGGKEYFLDAQGSFVDSPQGAYCAGREEVLALLKHICHYSLYAYEDELRQGFVTVAGGHRIGIAGQAVMEERDRIRTIKNISYLNIRVAHQIKGVADSILPAMYEQGHLKNILIVSPPGCGKTTMLRDLIRQISNGNAYGEGMCVGVVDERSELAGSYMGVPQNDIGIRTDVLDACPKALGMMLLLRSMSPQVIAIDELGGREDMQALCQAASCGSKILATIHGNGIEDVVQKFYGENENAGRIFECFLLLGKENGKLVIRRIAGREEVYAALSGRKHDNSRVLWAGNVVSGAISEPLAKSAHPAGDFGIIDGGNPIR